MTNLYHGVSERNANLRCEDLHPGYDGLIHFLPDRDAVDDYYGRSVECRGQIDLESIPELDDLYDWNPYIMASELESRGIITRDEREKIEGDVSDNDYIKRFSVEDLRMHLADRLGIDDDESIRQVHP